MIRFRKIAAVAVAVLVVGMAGPARAQAPASCPSVISHRAGNDVDPGNVPAGFVGPENTIEGIAAAANLGARSVEMDVRWTKGDGTASYPGWPVLMHDPTVDRTTNGTGPVSALGLNATLALYANDYTPPGTTPSFKTSYPNAHVPYAWSFLDQLQVSGVDGLLHINIAPNRVQMDKLMYYVGLFPLLDGHLTYMGDADVIGPMHSWYPALTYAYIEYPPANTVRSVAGIRATGAGIYVLPIQNADLDAAAVAYWHAAGIKVWAWSSDTESIDVQANWKKAADIGIDTLISNHAAQVSDYYGTYC